eukprot:222499-Prymnesium_polylepis.2
MLSDSTLPLPHCSLQSGASVLWRTRHRVQAVLGDWKPDDDHRAGDRWRGRWACGGRGSGILPQESWAEAPQRD